MTSASPQRIGVPYHLDQDDKRLFDRIIFSVKDRRKRMNVLSV